MQYGPGLPEQSLQFFDQDLRQAQLRGRGSEWQRDGYQLRRRYLHAALPERQEVSIGLRLSKQGLRFHH